MSTRHDFRDRHRLTVESHKALFSQRGPDKPVLCFKRIDRCLDLGNRRQGSRHLGQRLDRGLRLRIQDDGLRACVGVLLQARDVPVQGHIVSDASIGSMNARRGNAQGGWIRSSYLRLFIEAREQLIGIAFDAALLQRL